MSTSTMKELSIERLRDSLPDYSIEEKIAIRNRLRFKEFCGQYGRDREAFVHDCFYWPRGQSPKDHQIEALCVLDERDKVCIRSPHGGGKSALDAWVIIHGIETREEAKIPTTAGSWNQLSRFLWPEVHKWAGRLRWDVIGHEPYTSEQLQVHALKISEIRQAFAVAPRDPNLLEGGHAGFIIDPTELDPEELLEIFGGLIGFVFDEAKSIRDPIWNAAEGAYAGTRKGSGQEGFAIANSVPGEPSGEFFKIHQRLPGRDDWGVMHWTLEMLLEAGMVTEEWVKRMGEKWGVDHPMYQNKVLGNFAENVQTQLIPISWILAANARWRAWKFSEAAVNNEPLEVGADVGRGGNLSVIIARSGDLVPNIIKMNVRDTMQVAGRIRPFLERGGRAFIDVIGLGAGCADRLHESFPKQVYAINAALPTKLTDGSGEMGFMNIRTANYWAIREWLDPENGSTAMVPPDDKLQAHLTVLKWWITSSGKIAITKKEDVEDELGESSDEGDALGFSFAGIGIVKHTSLKDAHDAATRILGKTHKTIMPEQGKVF